MRLPPEVMIQLRTLVEEMPEGRSFSVSIHTDGVRKWSTELRVTQNILLGTASFETTTGQYKIEGRALNGRDANAPPQRELPTTRPLNVSRAGRGQRCAGGDGSATER